jgi:hypothetical protein
VASSFTVMTFRADKELREFTETRREYR